ncbi:prepilin-type N-terminal cleavage/methylation domain-containing protein [Parelusimicrobium proximum]|uniref:type IV pilin protein n=1 Tax=Parelusimicrobium proximum TaxID=3228953 RepID=UPI003D174F81
MKKGFIKSCHSEPLKAAWNLPFSDRINNRSRALRATDDNFTLIRMRSPRRDDLNKSSLLRTPSSSLPLYSVGFTLIELLVVVLIIAVLAAVALPQYTKTVYRTRGATQLSTLKALRDSLDRYYMANDAWPQSFDALDITIGAAISTNQASYIAVQASDKNVYYFNINSGVAASSSTGFTDQTNRFGFGINTDYSMNCYADKTKPNANSVCTSMGFTFSNTSGSFNYYIQSN